MSTVNHQSLFIYRATVAGAAGAVLAPVAVVGVIGLWAIRPQVLLVVPWRPG